MPKRPSSSSAPPPRRPGMGLAAVQLGVAMLWLGLYVDGGSWPMLLAAVAFIVVAALTAYNVQKRRREAAPPDRSTRPRPSERRRS